MNVFRRLNHYFLHHEDEVAHLSDYVWFYGFAGGSIVLSIILLVKIITF